MRLDQEGFGSLSAVLAIASHRNGRQFLWACCAPLLRLHPQGNVPAWAFAGRAFRRLWGMSVPFSLSAPLLCQIIVAILCGNFEQFANKRPHGWMPHAKTAPASCCGNRGGSFALFVLFQALTQLLAGVLDRSPGGCQNCRAFGNHSSPSGYCSTLPFELSSFGL